MTSNLKEEILNKNDVQFVELETKKSIWWIPIVFIFEVFFLALFFLESFQIMAIFLTIFFGIIQIILIKGLKKIRQDAFKGIKLVGDLKVSEKYKLKSKGSSTFHLDCCDFNGISIFEKAKVNQSIFENVEIGDTIYVEFLPISKIRMRFEKKS